MANNLDGFYYCDLGSCSMIFHLLQLHLQEQYIKTKKTNSELNLLSSDLYAEIYIETGVDLDNREFIFDVYARKSILLIENMVEFLKSIPGIDSISFEDQKTLLKGKYKGCNCFTNKN